MSSVPQNDVSHLIVFSSEIFLLSYRYTSYHTLCFQNLCRTTQLSVKYVNWIVTKNSTDGTIIKVTKIQSSPTKLFSYCYSFSYVLLPCFLISSFNTLAFTEQSCIALPILYHFINSLVSHLNLHHISLDITIFVIFFPIASKTIGSNCP